MGRESVYISDLTITNSKFDLINIYRLFQSIMAEYTTFSKFFGTFTEIDCILDHIFWVAFLATGHIPVWGIYGESVLIYLQSFVSRVTSEGRRCHQLLLIERDPEGSAPICPHPWLTLDGSTWSVACNFIASLEDRDLPHPSISRVCHVVDTHGLKPCGPVWPTLSLDESGPVLPLLTLGTSLGVSWCI